MSWSARAHFQDVKKVGGRKVVQVKAHSIIFEDTLPLKVQERVKKDICAAREPKRPRKPVTGEDERRAARTLRRRRYEMIKGQEKVERAKARAVRAAVNYADAMEEGQYDAEDEDDGEDEIEDGDVELSSSSGSDLTDLPDDE